MGEIRDYAAFARRRCPDFSDGIRVARCVAGKISELYRKIVVAAGEATAFGRPRAYSDASQLIG